MNRTSRLQLAGVLVLFLVASGIGTAATATDVVLSPDDDVVSPGETVSYDVVVRNANGGVGSFNVTVASNDSSVASIQGVQYADSPSYANQPTATDEVTVAATGMDTLDSGPVRIATVTVAAEGAGTARIALSVEALGTEGGREYRLANVTGESLTVRENTTSTPTPTPVPPSSEEDDDSSGGSSGGDGGGNDRYDDSDDEPTTPTPTDRQSDVVTVSPALTATENGTRTNVSVESVGTNATVALELDAPIGSNATAGNDTSGSNTTLDALNLTLTDDARNGTVRVATSDESDVATPEPPHASAVGYVEVELDGFDDGAVANASFTFTVDAERREALGGNPEEVTLYRYHDGEWRPLQTEHVTGDHYRAVTPGFSTFAIGVDRANVTVTGTRLQRSVVSVGENVSVVATLRNDGRATGTVSVELATRETVLHTETVRLDPADNGTVRLNASLTTPGEYALTVENASVGNVTVAGVTTTRSPATTTRRPTTSGTPTPQTTSVEPPKTPATTTATGIADRFTSGFSGAVLLVGATAAMLFAVLAVRRQFG